MAFSFPPISLLTVQVPGLLGSAHRLLSSSSYHHEVVSLFQGRGHPGISAQPRPDSSRMTVSSSAVSQMGERWQQGPGRWVGFQSGSGALCGHCSSLALSLPFCQGSREFLGTFSVTLHTEQRTPRKTAGTAGPESVRVTEARGPFICACFP